MAAPWFPFYPADWLRDSALRAVSVASRGVWIDLLALMHQSPHRGRLELPTGQPPTAAQLARMLGLHPNASARYLTELEQAGVLTRDGQTLVSRRMVRDEARRVAAVEHGSKGGSPLLRGTAGDKGRDNPTLIPSPIPGDNPPPNPRHNPPDNPTPAPPSHSPPVRSHSQNQRTTPPERNGSGCIGAGAVPSGNARATPVTPPLTPPVTPPQAESAWELWDNLHRTHLHRPAPLDLDAAKAFAEYDRQCGRERFQQTVMVFLTDRGRTVFSAAVLATPVVWQRYLNVAEARTAQPGPAPADIPPEWMEKFRNHAHGLCHGDPVTPLLQKAGITETRLVEAMVASVPRDGRSSCLESYLLGRRGALTLAGPEALTAWREAHLPKETVR